jgi:hypothetical protein
MRKLICIGVIGLAGLSVAAPRGLAADNSGTGFVATLEGKNEVPPVSTAMTGTAHFHLVDNNQVLAFTLTLQDTSKVFVAHIHMGAEGVNGPVVAFLFGALPPPGLTQDNVRVQGFLTDANLIGPLAHKTIADLVALMEAGNAYVNAHTVDHPGGAARGQIAVEVDESD